MCTGRTHARICLDTERDLRQLMASVEAAEARGQIERWWEGEKLTMAEYIKELVRRELAHRARAMMSRLARARRRKEGRDRAGRLGPTAAELVRGDYDLAEHEGLVAQAST